MSEPLNLPDQYNMDLIPQSPSAGLIGYLMYMSSPAARRTMSSGARNPTPTTPLLWLRIEGVFGCLTAPLLNPPFQNAFRVSTAPFIQLFTWLVSHTLDLHNLYNKFEGFDIYKDQ